MKLAVSLLCEDPHHPAGFSSMIQEMLRSSGRLFPDVTWLVYAAGGHEVVTDIPGVEWHTGFPGNDHIARRLAVDHFMLGTHAYRRGAQALVTVGFVPVHSPVPTIMHLLSLHHLDPRNEMMRLNKLYRRAAIATGVRRAALVITNSRFTADQILSSTSMDPEKLLISNEGVDHTRFHPRQAPGEIDALRQTVGLAPGYVLAISNLYPYKQSRLVLEAYARLPKALRERHELVFVGGDWAGQRAQLSAAASALGVSNHVRFLGWVDSEWLPAIFRHAAVHVLASREETWGRTVTEAMACGCPCIVNDIPVMQEVTRGQALIVRFASVEAASQGLEQILTDAGTRARLRAGGIDRAADLSFDRLTRERMGRIIELLA